MLRLPCTLCLLTLSLSLPGFSADAPSVVLDDMEDLAAWHTGGQKEATLSPERTLVSEGKQALRFSVKTDHTADETIQGQQYPKGWPRVERNPVPPLDLSGVRSLAFDIYTLSSRTALPGSSLQIILRDAGGDGWSSNLGQLPLGTWKHFSLDLGTFTRNRIEHWQFYLSESDYLHGDEVSFIIDNVRGLAAQRSRVLVPALQAKLAALDLLAGDVLPEALVPRVAEARRSAASIAARYAGLARLDLAASNALDVECDALRASVGDLLIAAGAARTVPDGSYCVGVETSLRKVFRDQAAFTPGRELRLALAANEREAVQVLVHPLTADIPRLSAEVSDLVAFDGSTLPRDCVELSAVGYVETQEKGYATERGGWWPDPLIPLDWPGSGKAGLGPLADAFAHKGETQPIWVTVRAPANARAGKYLGTLTLRPEGLPTTTLALTVTVRNFALPLRPRLKTAFTFSEAEMARFYNLPALTVEQRRACEAFLLERKTNPMSLYTPYAWPGLEDVGFMAQRGLNAYCLGYAPGTPAEIGDLVYYRWLRDQRRWLARHGLDADAWLYGYDEPHCRPDFETLKGIMREVYGMVEDAAPGMPRGSTTAIVPDLVGAVNLWVPQTMQVARQDTLARQHAGDQVWTYVACSPAHPFANIFVDYPALDHRLLFWQTWQEGCTGFLYYFTDLWQANYKNLERRWPDIPWNPRPVADFAFNGDGILLYPGPNATLLSSVRQEVITDGIEDFDVLCLLRDAARKLRQVAPEQANLAAEAEAACQVPAELSTSLTEFTHDPAVLLAARDRADDVLSRVIAALPDGAWGEVLIAEPPLSPKAAVEPAAGPADLPFTCGFETAGGMAPWVSRSVPGASAQRGTVAGMTGSACGISRGAGKGWADWESPLLSVTAGRQCVVRLAANSQLKSGALRVFLFKYDADQMPLDVATAARGAIGPALVGQTEAGDGWERRRFMRGIEPGVAMVRLYLQCFGTEGQVAVDDISVTQEDAEVGLVDDCDEPGGWNPSFAEAHLTRERTIVHQGDGALRFTVNVDHKGGEAAYPIGWPHLRWYPSPALDWTGKQELTFWVYAESSRETLPKQAVMLSVQSDGGDAISTPLTFDNCVWQQVTVPLTGKRLTAVNHLELYVCESEYQDGDRVSFIIDDMRVK